MHQKSQNSGAKPPDYAILKFHGWPNIKFCTCYFYGVYSDGLVRQKPLATKGFNLHLLRSFGRGIKFIYCQFTFVDHSPETLSKTLQTLIDGNLGNVSAGSTLFAVPNHTLDRGKWMLRDKKCRVQKCPEVFSLKCDSRSSRDKLTPELGFRVGFSS